MAKFLKTKEDMKSMLDQFDTILLDCDGVIWHGNELVPDVKEALEYFRTLKKDIVFVSNNATKSRPQYKQKFDKLGIQASEDEIFGSAYASAVYFSQILKFPKDKKVFVIGEKGLEDELHSEGINTCGGSDPESNKPLPSQDFSSIKHDSEIGAVLCGFDTHINYAKLARAHLALTLDKSTEFVITNDDSTFPSNGVLYPGSGSLSAPLRYSTGRDPIVVGKPNKSMMDCIVAKRHFDRSRTLMVGDRLNTDIEFGIKGGTSTMLVLTGVNKVDDIESSGTTPSYIVNSLGDFRALAEE
ncbi:2-phosphoglycolate phosphatase [Phaffia rhodozyma]|uniref:4-nitrophenylphosphatase n=1 Tax=Phaffia rhodozyma TaxID=264483 RepID=A0A0F7SQB8_PHARH|nr:2-phosphoglycolate phosphatase [Phaffia rhodozyma]